jgi:hypothetical protein
MASLAALTRGDGRSTAIRWETAATVFGPRVKHQNVAESQSGLRCDRIWIMTETIEFQSRVGRDGMLDLHVPLGEMGAGADVVVTIRRLHSQPQPQTGDAGQWHHLVNESYGSCAGLGLERPQQGQYETREHAE